ncbi:MAG: hypothetical protein ACK4N5_22185, partial [Myxococcales bacterium]
DLAAALESDLRGAGAGVSRERAALQAGLANLASAPDLDAAREAFATASAALEALVRATGTAGVAGLRPASCPMALGGRGAGWLQTGETVANPYFGARMLRCGSLAEPLGAAGHAGHDHR